MTNKLYYGDNLQVLREHIADESVASAWAGTVSAWCASRWATASSGPTCAIPSTPTSAASPEMAFDRRADGSLALSPLVHWSAGRAARMGTLADGGYNGQILFDPATVESFA